ncbi:MAG TPA: ABC transporter permease [Nitratifractor sp.]|nr:ABC transporter permease [Nitratifractor sp.]
MREFYNSRFVHKFVRHYLRYDRDNPFIFISALLALIGIALGVMVLMIGIGVTNGTHQEFKKRLFTMNYPLTVLAYDNKGVPKSELSKLTEQFRDIKISPYYTTQVIAKNADSVQGSILYGVDFGKEAAINSIFQKAYRDSNRSVKSKYRVILGDDLALSLGLRVGDKITLFFSHQQAVGFGSMPLQKRFTIVGTFDSGLTAYDKGIIYTTHEAFEKVLKKVPNVYDGAHIFSDKPMDIIQSMKASLPENMGVEGWWEQNGGFFEAMQMEKKALFLVLLLIILVASLNIISSLLMTVMSRRSEIALMRTLGASQKEISRIFFYLGITIGVLGMFLGTLLGLFGIWLLTTYNIISLPADIYATSKLPIDLPLSDFLKIIGGTAVIVVLASIYPAIRASRTDILTVLRNE